MGWPTAKLGDVIETIMGQAPSGKDCNREGVGTPFVKVGEFGDERPVIKEWTIDPKKLAKRGDVLLCVVGATCGKINLGDDCAIGRSVAALRPLDGKITQHYLYYFMQGKVEDFREGAQGAAQTVISKVMIAAAIIPLPPIPEQKRIVALLDTVFADLEQTRAKTEQNLKNARELFESKKLSLFESLSNSSNLSPLPLVCENIFAGGDAPQKGLYSKEETEKFNIPIYANAVKNNGLYGFTDYSRANEPSITIAARGSGTGHIELRAEPFLPIVRLIVLTPNKELISLEYLKHALQTLDILRSGSAIPQLTVPMIKEYSIPVPNLKVQGRTVVELERLAVYIERVEAIYQEKLIAVDELKKSILQKAFSGELSDSAKQIQLNEVLV
ncbi:restriction endonuclease subunit S [Colwellia sp. 6M3]|uniref:restriction endonuclease subunit S n=1 Tax=Colwellia sp. 6M3 TaxID=2759849 RepID=UPI0015F551B3|nr:restriction endonuclease subunit S [Colwellia sp. 6M3]MBA6416948.1 restriction endonuclease subunit S [Colwellia sp. 6M3]